MERYPAPGNVFKKTYQFDGVQGFLPTLMILTL